jgi:autotransporter-associated beta strand protein
MKKLFQYKLIAWITNMVCGRVYAEWRVLYNKLHLCVELAGIKTRIPLTYFWQQIKEVAGFNDLENKEKREKKTFPHNSLVYAINILILNMVLGPVLSAQTGIATYYYTTSNATQTFTVPNGVTSVTLKAWGGGGSGGNKNADARGGGGGGGYVTNTYSVSAGQTISIVVGKGGVIVSNTLTGVSGEASSYKYNFTGYSTVTAGGGIGSTDDFLGLGGSISGTYGTGSKIGGSGANRVGKDTQGGGGGGCDPVATDASSQTGGSPNGGNGGNINQSGQNGTAPGGGGGGKGDGVWPTYLSGNGANGQVIVTYDCPTASLTSTSATTPICAGSTSTVTLSNTTTSNLPVGTYTVTYNLTGTNTATGATATMTVSTAGSGTFTTSALANGGATTVTVTNLASATCSSAISSNSTASIMVIANGTWLGINTNWNDATNWCGGIPGNSTDVTIPSGLSNYPSIATTGTCRTIANMAGGSISGTGTLTIAGNAGAAISNISGTGITISCPVVMPASASVTVTGSLDISGVISGAATSLTKAGNGILTLSGANTYAGTTTISSGTLKLRNASALGTTGGGTLITAGAALDLNGIDYTNAERLTVYGTGILSGGAITNSSASSALV